ncbi:LAFA_0D05578g1_1 [Lachancea sp. 'fantastica']|nr:LAFA_0D05578g1_1 [Lachancea sp. 'fantastica']
MELFIDRVDKTVTFGIDLYSFEVKPDQIFHGFKNIPRKPHVHVVHFQHSNDGVRYGYFFESDSNVSVQFEYDAADEIFVPRIIETEQQKTDAYNKFQELNPFMVPYPSIDEEDTWNVLSNHIRMLDLRYMASCSDPCVYMDSAITTKEEEGILSRTLASSGHQAGDVTSAGLVMKYTPIVFKSKEAMRDEFKMHDFFDKSYYLNDVILARFHHNSILSLIGELQCAFLSAMLFGNYGSSLQWHNIVELIASSSTVSPKVLLQLDSLLARQLAVVPDFYADMLLNEDAWVRILASVHHGKALVLTRDAAHRLWPHLNEDEEEAEHGLAQVLAGDENMLHNLGDSDVDSDEPVVVERIIYRHT